MNVSSSGPIRPRARMTRVARSVAASASLMQISHQAGILESSGATHRGHPGGDVEQGAGRAGGADAPVMADV